VEHPRPQNTKLYKLAKMIPIPPIRDFIELYFRTNYATDPIMYITMNLFKLGWEAPSSFRGHGSD
jgi:hypothetical protein